MEGRGGLLGDSAIKGIFGEYVTAGKFADMAKEMMMKAFIYNIFIAQIRGLPREAGRGRDRWAARWGVVQHSISRNCFKRRDARGRPRLRRQRDGVVPVIPM